MDNDEKWIKERRSNLDVSHGDDLRAALARGREQGRAEGAESARGWTDALDAELTRVRNALTRFGVPDTAGEVPHHRAIQPAERVDMLGDDRDRLAKRVEELEQRLEVEEDEHAATRVRLATRTRSCGDGERIGALESRLAAQESRLTELVEVLEAHERDLASVSITPSNITRHRDLADRLAALRAPVDGAKADPAIVESILTDNVMERDMLIAEALRLIEGVGIPAAGTFPETLHVAVTGVIAALATARRERDAYRKAKEENDERFMTERDDARRERDEAVAIVRDWLVWRSVHHVSDVHFPDLASVLSRARALVAGEEGAGPNAAGIAAALSTWQAERLANEALAGGPPTPHDCGDGPVNDEPGATTWRGLVDAKEAEIAGWREASKAMTGEIATLRAQLDTALARVAELEAREVAANHRALGLQYELDTGVAALQERDRESRWIIEHIPMMQGSPTFEARVAEYLSATPPADPARGLIERLVAAYDGCSRRGTIEECNAQERAVYDAIRDLRARIAELEARDREGRWIVQESRNACDTEPCAYGKQHRHDDYDCRRTAYLSGAAPPDPARGLIERAVGWIHTRFHETGVSEPASRLLQDLRAYLGGGT